MPHYYSIGTRAQSAAATTLSPAKPTVLALSSGALIAVVTTKNNDTHATATSGWTKLDQVNNGASFTASLWIAAQGAAAPVFTWTGSVACSAIIAYYPDAAGATDSATIGASTSNTGTGSSHTTSAIVSTRANSLAVLIDVLASNNAYPTPAGWTDNSTSGSSTDGGRYYFGSKSLGASGTSSGGSTMTVTAATWISWEIELQQSLPTAAGVNVSKEESGAWLEPPAGVVVSKIEAGAWLEPAVVSSGRRRVSLM
jgi:hypothetical protein